MNWPTVSRRGREVTRISNEGVIKADIRIQKKKKTVSESKTSSGQFKSKL